MGRDKSLLAWEGTDLLGHTLDRLRTACRHVRILSGAERRYADRGVPVVLDATPDAEPTDVLFLGLDLPFVPASLLAHLLELAEGADAVVPVSPRGEEPLCAVYGHACLAPARRCVAEGRLKMTAFWPEVRVRHVEAADLAAFGDPEHLFRNLNTPEEYEAARRLR